MVKSLPEASYTTWGHKWAKGVIWGEEGACIGSCFQLEAFQGNRQLLAEGGRGSVVLEEQINAPNDYLN